MEAEKIILIIQNLTIPFIALLIFILAIVFRKSIYNAFNRVMKLKVNKDGTQIDLHNEGISKDEEDSLSKLSDTNQVIKGDEENKKEDDLKGENFYLKIISFLENKEVEKADELYYDRIKKKNDKKEIEKEEIIYFYLKADSGDIKSLESLKEKTENTVIDIENQNLSKAYLAKVYKKNSNYDNAVILYKDLLNNVNDYDERKIFIDKLVEVLKYIDKKDEAIDILMNEIHRESNEQYLHAIYYNLYNIYGNNEIGLCALEKAISLSPNNMDYRIKAGYDNIYKDSLLSLFHYDISYRFDSSQDYLGNNMGVVLNNFDLKMKAVDYYKKSIDSGCSLAASNLAALYYQAGFYDDAKKILIEAKKSKETHKNVGSKISELENMKEQSDKKYDEYLKDGLLIHRFLISFSDAIFIKKNNLELNNSMWRNFENVNIRINIISNKMECVWGEDDKNMIKGDMQNHGAVFNYYEKRYSMGLGRFEYEKLHSGYFYFSNNLDKAFYMIVHKKHVEFVEFIPVQTQDVILLDS